MFFICLGIFFNRRLIAEGKPYPLSGRSLIDPRRQQHEDGALDAQSVMTREVESAEEFEDVIDDDNVERDPPATEIPSKTRQPAPNEAFFAVPDIESQQRPNEEGNHSTIHVKRKDTIINNVMSEMHFVCGISTALCTMCCVESTFCQDIGAADWCCDDQ